MTPGRRLPERFWSNRAVGRRLPWRPLGTGPPRFLRTRTASLNEAEAALHEERWGTAADRLVFMLTSGVPAGRPQILLLPGLGSVGYLEEALVDMEAPRAPDLQPSRGDAVSEGRLGTYAHDSDRPDRWVSCEQG